MKDNERKGFLAELRNFNSEEFDCPTEGSLLILRYLKAVVLTLDKLEEKLNEIQKNEK